MKYWYYNKKINTFYFASFLDSSINLVKEKSGNFSLINLTNILTTFFVSFSLFTVFWRLFFVVLSSSFVLAFDSIDIWRFFFLFL